MRNTECHERNMKNILTGVFYTYPLRLTFIVFRKVSEVEKAAKTCLEIRNASLKKEFYSDNFIILYED